ncbi:NAD(P)/FAD-dependent oxidoreductase [Streptomyces sp. NBC_00878]|uniref:flavin monoamine oxidase family protein n=1 Tax=Streptomyces sp. NBC_00878 TaxID=2975854 RepID=UPI0022501353|nr:NAD(P)/FAD-dependent oxidoreductase [Streptomyces sp. NBC_00878]MCX4904524.1 FAD-dependent oxidoreductase [Streptomyces sp. NBC_00878]
MYAQDLPGARHWSGQGAKRITVIGAGLAGLVAAHELERLGHSVQVLEARLAVGGRVRTHVFSGRANGPLVELGAMRIPASHHRTMQWIDILGLSDRVRQFRTLFSDDASYLESRTGHLRVRDASPTLVKAFSEGLPPGSDYHAETVLCAAWLTASVNAVAPGAFRRDLHTGLNVELLDLLENIDVRPYIVASGANERVDLNRFFANNPDFARTSGLRNFFDDVIVETSSALFRLDGGMDQIAQRLAERLRGPILRGRRVVGLHVQRDGVLVEVQRGLATAPRRSDYVLCTVPFSVLRRMRLSGIGDDKVAMIHDMQYWPATKIAVHCQEAFWERDGISGGGSFTGGLVRQTYYPPVESDPRLGAALLASYTLGPDADALGREHPDRRVAVVLDELSAIHPELNSPGMVLDVVSQAWGEDPTSMGAAAVRWSKDAATAEEERVLAARPERTLFFAGDHCSPHPAWIEGAIESGIAAAQDVHAALPVDHRVLATGYQGLPGGSA